MLLALFKAHSGCKELTAVKSCSGSHLWACHTCTQKGNTIVSRFLPQWRLVKARMKVLHDHALDRITFAVGLPAIRDVIGMRRWYSGGDGLEQHVKANQDTRVEISVSTIGSEASLCVRDHGAGIPSEHIPRLTERFYRIDAGASRANGGTGLGLALVKHIALRHRGRLKITSHLGDGSRFEALLPLS
jgi:hypothetical protein